MTNWFYIDNSGERKGPFSEREFGELIEVGKIVPGTLVQSEGMPEFSPLERVWPPDAVPPLPAGEDSCSERTGPPWENRNQLGLVSAALRTVKGVLFHPTETFLEMKRSGGLASPLFYNVLLASIGWMAAVIYQVTLTQLTNFNPEQKQAFSFLGTHPISIVGAILALAVVAPIVTAAGSFFGAGLLHLSLMICGGAKQPFETTFRVLAYTYGSTMLFQLIPLGGMIGGIWCIVSASIGLSKAHGIGAGRAVLAFLLPMIFCCGLAAASLVGVAAWVGKL